MKRPKPYDSAAVAQILRGFLEPDDRVISAAVRAAQGVSWDNAVGDMLKADGGNRGQFGSFFKPDELREAMKEAWRAGIIEAIRSSERAAIPSPPYRPPGDKE